MAENALERAVLVAARAWAKSVQADRAEGFHGPLAEAVDRYEAWLATQDPTVSELGWHEVAAGDEVRSRKNGRWYAVRSVLRVAGGKTRLELVGVPKPIERPSDAEPTATVRRGPDGQAVDTLLNVFSSSGDPA